MFPIHCSFAKSVPMPKFRFRRGGFRQRWSSYLFVALTCVVTATFKSLSWTASSQRPFCGQTAEPCPLHPGDVPLGRESNIPVHEKQHDTVAPVMNRQAALEVLGFRAGADPSKTELKHAFKKEVLRVHPDRPGGDGERLLEIKAAYEILVSPPRAAAPKYGRKGPTTGWRVEDFLDVEEEYLTDMWKEIGFNPYTGEVYEPLTGKPYPSSHIYQDWEKHSHRGQAPAGQQSEKATKTAVDGVAQIADPSQAIFPGLLVAFALAVSVSSQVEDPRGSGPAASQPTAPVAVRSVPTLVPPAPAPVSVVSQEIAWDAEYALALATAKENGVPVVAGGVDMTPERLSKWLALPEQDYLKNMWAPMRPSEELDETTLTIQEKCWRSFGSADRFNHMVNTLTSLLHENDGPKARYRSVMAMVGQKSLIDIATSLQVLEKLEFAELPASGEAEMHGTRLFQDQVSGRELIRMLQPSTGQKVVLIGTSRIPQKYIDGLSNPLGHAMPGLKALIGYLEDPVLVMDKTKLELEEFAADMKPLTGIVGSPEIRGSSSLELFSKPPWDAVE